ncbi:MAG TPA: ATP-dependent 6-phosphofructokinase [Anaerolineales bacterium]|nr:ATP-dependent 6-phosphofructokinase [Anaerolineales bacterium]HMR98777.1 ATP-dependent 6-phosphofructokinase [Anaerolineales bacterium]HNQ93727.1 ATP-dependent 6-phosphofructokinase [Anaerolineales bacterium]HNS59891.1 ATP-dependent 6-phosphofructokinase [Anaerolineales bacterium]
MKRIGILTGGGDAPGLNAVIRAAVKTAIYEYNSEVVGIRNGYDGFIEADGIVPLTIESVRGLLPRGGTILGAANRGNPYARKIIRDGKEVMIDVSDEIIKGIKRLEMDALLVLGGDGTLHIAHALYKKGAPIIGVPKTIDNDIGGTEFTFGFDTAVNTATEAIDKLHTTAEAHHRVMVLELMGRDAGFIALHAGVAGGADVILIPEIPFKFESILAQVRQRVQDGYLFSIIVVSEGAKPQGGEQVFSRGGDEIYVPRLGGIGHRVGEFIEKHGYESRVTVLGHLQRGGSPTPFDRWLATRFGAAAVRLAAEGKFDRMVALRAGKIVDILLEEVTAITKRVDVNDDAVLAARGMGVSFGDE